MTSILYYPNADINFIFGRESMRLITNIVNKITKYQINQKKKRQPKMHSFVNENDGGGVAWDNTTISSCVRDIPIQCFFVSIFENIHLYPSIFYFCFSWGVISLRIVMWIKLRWNFNFIRRSFFLTIFRCRWQKKIHHFVWRQTIHTWWVWAEDVWVRL